MMKRLQSRRTFLKQAALLPFVASTGLTNAALAPALPASPGSVARPAIMTVAGPIPLADLGPALAHEHIMSIFGAPAAATYAYDQVALRAAVLPALKALRSDGVAAIFDCTTAYFGRDPAILRELSRESGIRLVTNTGYYGASNGRYLPPGLAALTADAIAARWIAEARDGIDNTGIRPGFIKLGINDGPLSPLDRTLLVAAARTHLASGLTIAVHTGANVAAAKEQQAILRAEGVPPEAWIWVHAHLAATGASGASEGADALVAAAKSGVWLSLDGWSSKAAPRLVELLARLKAAGLLHRVLLSHDGNLFPALGRPPRPMSFLFTEGRAMLRAAGFTDEAWKQLTQTNPATAYAVRPRQ